MTQTIRRRRIEVLVDAPLARRVVEAARISGISAWTMLPTLEGEGKGGHWTKISAGSDIKFPVSCEHCAQ